MVKLVNFVSATDFMCRKITAETLAKIFRVDAQRIAHARLSDNAKYGRARPPVNWRPQAIKFAREQIQQWDEFARELESDIQKLEAVENIGE